MAPRPRGRRPRCRWLSVSVGEHPNPGARSTRRLLPWLSRDVPMSVSDVARHVVPTFGTSHTRSCRRPSALSESSVCAHRRTQPIISKPRLSSETFSAMLSSGRGRSSHPQRPRPGVHHLRARSAASPMITRAGARVSASPALLQRRMLTVREIRRQGVRARRWFAGAAGAYCGHHAVPIPPEGAWARASSGGASCVLGRGREAEEHLRRGTRATVR